MKTSRSLVDSSTIGTVSGPDSPKIMLTSVPHGWVRRYEKDGTDTHLPLFFLIYFIFSIIFKETNAYDKYLSWLESLKQCHGDI